MLDMYDSIAVNILRPFTSALWTVMTPMNEEQRSKEIGYEASSTRSRRC